MRTSISGILFLLLAAPAIALAQAPCNNGSCAPGGSCQPAACDGGACNGGGGLIAKLRSRCQSGECVTQGYGNPDLFYNFYVGPDCGSVPAQMYIAPHPVPSHVGHTFYTYQPLMPHEMLYPHKRHYHRYYDEGRGMNRTKVSWSKSPGYRASNFLGYFSVPR